MKSRTYVPKTSSQTALLLPAEFEALVARVRRNIRRVQSFGQGAIYVNLIATTFGLAWWLNGADVFWGTVSSFVLVLVLTQYVKTQGIRAFTKDAERILTFIKHTHEPTHLRAILDLCTPDKNLGGIWEKVSWTADLAVLRLLPLVRPIHTEIFTTQHRARLRYDLFHRSNDSGLGYWRDSWYCLLVLGALEQIGDHRDLADVERVLQEPYMPEEVCAAAQRCAQTITERLVRTDHRDSLLRPSHTPEATETLLRPAEERIDTPPQELLRADKTSSE